MNVARYVNTTELKFTVEFVTPCFLGGADGNAEIRAAPFKNLIRRWWRIVNGNLSPEDLWKKEAELFGSTEKNPDIIEENKSLPKSQKKVEIFGKSKVELKIIDSSKVNIISARPIRFADETMIHPEVEKNGGQIPFETYLGMGPIFGSDYKKSYIKEGSIIKFSLTVPKRQDNSIYVEFIKTLTLINMFGSIGSRSRNGWGSIRLIGKWPESDLLDSAINWSTVFTSDDKRVYPFYLGKDKNGYMIWKSEKFPYWSDAMAFLAKAYMETRTNFKFKKNNSKNQVIEQRHLLGYPVTHHNVKGWDRLPSQLLLKVIKTPEQKYIAQIMHLPSAIPLKWDSESAGAGQGKTWDEVHKFLDSYDGLHRVIGASK